MAKANSFDHISNSAVKVLARLAAKRAVQNELRDQGVRVSLYPYAELMRLAQQYRGRARVLVTRSKDNDLRICAGEYGWADTYSPAVGAMPSWLLTSVQREAKWRKD